jgi:hypothetical protein
VPACFFFACLSVQSVGGCDNVVAVVPKAVRADAAAESQDAVVLRAPDALAAKELRKRLTASASQMAAVAGLLEVRTGGGRCQQQGVTGVWVGTFVWKQCCVQQQ